MTTTGRRLLAAIALFVGCAHAGPTGDTFVNVDQNDAKSSYNLSEYNIFENSDLLWTQKAFVAPQMHPWESLFYDQASHSYTWEKWYNDTLDRYGGVDSVVMWATYPQLGIDERNSFDMYRTLPGGFSGVKKMIESWKAGVKDRDVRVLTGWNSWDTVTRQENGRTENWGTNLAAMNSAIGAAGFNADVKHCPQEGMWTKDGNGSGGTHWAIQPEKLKQCKGLYNDFTMGWAEWLGAKQGEFSDGAALPLDGYRLQVDPRFKTYYQDRWKQPSLTTHDVQEGVAMIQSAYQSAAGWSSWEVKC
jgi:hypothetical protein